MVSDLAAHTGYWLRMVSNAVSQDFARKLADQGVTVAEWAVMRVLYDGLGNPKYNPCPLLIKMVDAGWLGKKSGRGFYKY